MSLRPNALAELGAVMAGPAEADGGLNMHRVGKTFAGVTVLRDVDLTVGAGEVHALLGHNGSGKSTLIKILSGFHKPDPGAEIVVAGCVLETGNPQASHSIGARFVHQDLGLFDTLSLLDNFFLGSRFPTRFGTISSRRAMDEVAQSIHRVGLQIDPRRSVAELSAVERTAVAVARALREESEAPARLVVLDEVTATMSATEADQMAELLEPITAGGGAILFVTHRPREALKLANRVSVLRDGHLIFSAPTIDVNGSHLTRLVTGDTHTAVVGRSRPARAHARRSEAVLHLDDLRGPGLEEISMDVGAGEIVGVAGLTGSGREDLLPVVFGHRPRHSGTVRVHGVSLVSGRTDQAIRAGLAYLPPDRANSAFRSLTVRENLTLADMSSFWKFPLLRRRAEKLDVAEWMQRMAVRPADAAERPLETLSGGNQQKVMLARWLRRDPSVLLLDEPAHGVDVGAKEVLHDQIREFASRGGAVCVSGVDNDELTALCTRVVVLAGGRIVADLRDGHLTTAAIAHASVHTREFAHV
jgi:ribose transport system ATP-binding protein